MPPPTDPGLDAAAHRRVGVALFNQVWTLLELSERTAEQDVEMIHAAHASGWHWMQVGTALNRARSEWQISRVYSVIGHPEPALWHARLSLSICEHEGFGDFDLAFAYEAIARAEAVAGNAEASSSWIARARAASEDIAESEDRELLLSDLETIA